MAGPLAHIARIMKGDSFRNGHQANIPAPGHSKDDRSVSLGLGEDGRVLVNCYSTKKNVSWREVRDLLRAKGLIDAAGRPTGYSPVSSQPVAETPDDAARRARAMALWNQGRDISRTLAQRYAESRAITEPLPSHSFRYLGQTPVAVFDEKVDFTKPALLTAIRTPESELSAIEITYLTLGGRRDPTLRLSRKTVGLFDPEAHCSVHIDPIADEMLFAEGAFTTLHARKRFRLPARALLCTRNMRFFQPPPGLKRAVIARDNGVDGDRSARILAATFRRHRISVEIVSPPAEFDDFDTYGRHDAMRAFRSALEAADGAGSAA
jgi:putative DNA primase/helicase